MSHCCSPAPVSGLRFVCPRCEKAGKAVSLLTLKHQVKLKHLTDVEAEPFAFCRTPECPVVYFSATGTTLTLDDVRRVPTTKKSDNPQLCYCFGVDTKMARAEIRATGQSTIPGLIAVEMKAGRCACEIRNPQGSCCFGNVNAGIKREMAAARAEPKID